MGMGNMKFRYPAEKLSAARRMLMPPHPRGLAASFAAAFHECSLGLRDITPSDLDDSARSWLTTITDTMNTEALSDPTGRGTWTVKAERLTDHEQSQFSSALNELADWFERHFHGD